MYASGVNQIDIAVQLDSKVLEAFPSLTVVAFRVAGARKIANIPTIASVFDAGVQACERSFVDFQQVSEHPIIDHWRRAYQAIGLKPSKFQSSIEALARRSLAGKLQKTQIGLVDLYNGVSLSHLAPLGAFDTDKLTTAPITVRHCDPKTDSFEPVSGNSSFHLNDQLVIYGQGNTILCYGFNHRDSRLASLSESTDDVIFFAEAVSEAQRERSKSAAHHLVEIFTTMGCRVTRPFTADKAHPEMAIPTPDHAERVPGPTRW